MGSGGLVYGGSVSSSRPPRRRFARSVATVAAAASVVALGAACTGDSALPPAGPAAGSTAKSAGAAAGSTADAGAAGTLPATAAPTTAASSGTTFEGAPPKLAALLETIYTGGELGGRATSTAASALGPRTPVKSPVRGTAAVGSWFGTPLAVVTSGDDVTLAVGPDWKVVGGWWPALGVSTPSLGGGPRWVLAIGSDARRGQPLTRSRADVLQVIGVDGAGGGGVMGLARDLWVPLSTGGKGKVNSAMVLGGPDAQLATVRAATRLPIEGYVVIGFDGFTQLVDEQGGIPITVPDPVDARHARIVIKAGPQVLTGKQALAYARERKTLPDGDFGRSRHQGELILAAAVKAKLAGPIAIPTALTSFGKVGASNLSAEQILTYTASLHRLNPLKVGRGVAKGAFGWAGQQSIVVLGEEARALFTRFQDGNLP